MAETLQNVEGAGILSTLAGLFFRGLEKALSDRAEYEEEMGVLKQINRIPIESIADGTSYILTVKLSPVRGKDNYYFVEAETDAPGIDVSKIHNKILKLDNTNAKQFRNTIDKLLSSSNYAAEMDRTDNPNQNNDPEVVGELNEGEENPSEEGEVTAEGEFQSLIDAANNWFKEKAVAATAPGDTSVEVKRQFAGNPSPNECFIKLDAVDSDTGKSVVEPKKIEIQMKNDKLELIDQQTFLESIKSAVDQFCQDNNLINPRYTVRSSIICATFIKDKEGIGLTAIKASDDLDKTMEIIYDIMDSDDFVDQLEEGQETSFTITDDGEDYNIEPIDEVDISNTLFEVYKMLSSMYITVRSLQDMIGFKVFQNDNFLNGVYLLTTDFQTRAATWVIGNEDVLPILKDPYALVPTFEKYRKYADNSDIPQVKSDLATDLRSLAEKLNFLSVDLCDDCQSDIDDFCNSLDAIIPTFRE